MLLSFRSGLDKYSRRTQLLIHIIADNTTPTLKRVTKELSFFNGVVHNGCYWNCIDKDESKSLGHNFYRRLFREVLRGNTIYKLFWLSSDFIETTSTNKYLPVFNYCIEGWKKFINLNY